MLSGTLSLYTTTTTTTISAVLKWDDRVATVASKAAEGLWFLKKLKRTGVSLDDLVHYY